MPILKENASGNLILIEKGKVLTLVSLEKWPMHTHIHISQTNDVDNDNEGEGDDDDVV